MVCLPVGNQYFIPYSWYSFIPYSWYVEMRKYMLFLRKFGIYHICGSMNDTLMLFHNWLNRSNFALRKKK